MLKTIIKRDGTHEPFEPSKLNKWSEWSTEDVRGRVDWPSVVMKTVKACGEIIDSQSLNEQLIKQCVRMKSWPYSLMAGRLYNAVIRKEMYGNEMPTVMALQLDLFDKGYMVDLGYTVAEYVEIEKFISHEKDMHMAYFQVKQIKKKYSLANRIKGKEQEFETPQYVFMRMAMTLAKDEPRDKKLSEVKAYYEAFSNCAVNAPSPNYMNLGTGHNGYASCCLYTTNDSARSLAIGDHIAYTMTYMSSGIGGYLNTRSLGDPIRGGIIEHKGKFNYYEALAKAVKANTQGGRGGACTTYFSVFDPEIEFLLMLQNPRTPIDSRNRDIHFAAMFNKLFAKKVLKDEQIFLFNSFTAPDLHAEFFGKDEKAFEELYNQYEQDANFHKKYISARSIALRLWEQRHEVATLYTLQIDEVNRHTPFIDPIYSSNLCVSPGTQILTSKGYFKISDLENEEVEVWNGEKFTKTTVRQTSEFAKLIKVHTDSGMWLECTPYHKFYVQQSYKDGDIVEVQASDLKPGMKLIKFNLPVIEGEIEFDKPYENGFYTGDGFRTPSGQCIYLYGEKRKLKHMFPDVQKWNVQENQDREIACYKDLCHKFFVPDARFTIKSRLDWLAGLSDSDGCIYRNQGNQQLVISSINKQFLERTSLMLQTLGVCSKVRFMSPEADKMLPANDGTGSNKLFHCQTSYRLIVPSNELQSLVKLGLTFHRLKVVEHEPQRNAMHFVQILDVKDEGRYDRTFCFTEEERHMGMFNGMLTGQCNEVLLPTAAYDHITDLYKSEDNGSEVATCTLGGIVITKVQSDDEYFNACYYALKMADKCIHMAHYELPHVGYTAKNRLSIGVGIIGLAHHLAAKGLKYDTLEGRNEIHRVAERHMYFLIKASLQLGKELGNAPWMHKTKWPQGWLPIDTYKKAIDETVTIDLQYDWESLRAEIIENGGIRHSTVAAHMPTESSSKASGSPNGPYPIRDLSLKKSDAQNVLEWCAPDNDLLEDQYQLAWDISTTDMMKVYGIIQKFTDQGISADFYTDRVKQPIVTSDDIINEMRAMVKYGVKSQYYQNTYSVESTAVENKAPDTPVAQEHEEGLSLAIVSLLSGTEKSENELDALVDEAMNDSGDNERGCASGVCTL